MLFLIVILLLMLITTICLLFYYSTVSWVLKASIFPLLIFLGMFISIYWNDVRGSPIVGYPPNEFVYVHHVLTPNKQIILWITSLDNRRHRMYIFPYDRETAQELAEAQQKGAGGQMTKGTFVEGNTPYRRGLELDDWQGPIDIVPKIQN
jgi:hypothetical protein